jgi:serine/alanine adding enzyme
MIELRATNPDLVPDVYFTREYGDLDASFRRGSWGTISDPAGSWQLPLVVTDLLDAREAVSPYGYAGLYVSGECSPDRAIENWRAAQELLRDIGVASVFLRFSPLEPHSRSIAEGLPGLKTVRTGETYLNSISDPDDMWAAMEGRARTAVRKARSSGMEARVRPAELHHLIGGSPFRTLYEQTMRRVGASEQYLFDDHYFEQLVSIPSSPLYLVEVSLADDVVAASLVMRHGDRAHYHLSGSDPAAARSGANALLVWSMIEWCAQQGISRCHLGGGVRREDGLSKFKRSFGGELVAFYTGQAVIMDDLYERLTAERAQALGVTVGDLTASGYFPAFRAGA